MGQLRCWLFSGLKRRSCLIVKVGRNNFCHKLVKKSSSNLSSKSFPLIFTKDFYQSLYFAVANFLWSSKIKSSWIHWKKWDFTCLPNSQGGMGFKDFASQNSTFLSKQAWRFLNNPSDYWVCLLKGIYCSQVSFWEVKVKSGVSWAWRSLLHGRDLLKVKGRWNVGSGKELSF